MSDPQPYFIAAMPKDTFVKDPAIIQAVVGQLVESKGALGDLVVILVPEGEAQESSRKIGVALGQDDGLGGLFPGLPGQG